MLKVKNIKGNSRRRNQAPKIKKEPNCISSTFTQYTGNNPDLKFPGQSTFDAWKTSILRRKLFCLILKTQLFTGISPHELY